MRAFLGTFLLATLLVGCRTAPLAAANASATQPPPAVSCSAQATSEAVGDRLQAMRATTETVHRITSTEADWRGAHAAVQQAIQDADSDLARCTLERAGAEMMLDRYLVLQAKDPAAADVALDYAERFVSFPAPDVELVLEVVTAFHAKWPEERVAAVALQAADAADAFVAAGGSCPACTDVAQAEKARAEAGQPPIYWSTRQAVAGRKLRALVR